MEDDVEENSPLLSRFRQRIHVNSPNSDKNDVILNHPVKKRSKHIDSGNSLVIFTGFNSLHNINSRDGLISAQNEDEEAPLKPKVEIEMERNDAEHVLAGTYESLDYDVCENMIHRKDEKKQGTKWIIKREIARWAVMGMIGIITGLIASLIDVAVEYSSQLKFSYIKHYVDTCAEHYCLVTPFLAWVGLNAVIVMVGSLLTAVIEPVAAGSGIPQIKCFLNGVKVPHVVRVKTLIVKVIGVVSAVAGGLAVGKEGPMIHSGAVVAAGISQGRSSTFKFDLKLFEYFRTDTEKRDFVSGGAAAGVSAAFGAPVGGVLFSLEEGASFWNQSLTWRIFFASMLSTVTLNIVASCRNGNCLDLSSPGLFNFGKFNQTSYGGVEIFMFIIMGVIGGLLGALFNHINYKLSLFRSRYIHFKLVRVIEAMMVALISGTVSFLVILAWNDCQPMRAEPSSYPVKFFCPAGQYSSTAWLFFQTPEEGVKHLFHDAEGTYSVVTLILYCLAFFFLACWTYGLSIPSGLFIPSLLVGAAWGRLFGQCLQLMFPHAVWLDSGKYALIGAAAQLGGIVRMTISLTVIIIEATGNITFGLPVMVVLMVSKWIGDLFNEGIYDMHIHLQGVPLLGWEPPVLSSNISASLLAIVFAFVISADHDQPALPYSLTMIIMICTVHYSNLKEGEVMSHPVTVLRTKEKVGRIVEILKSESHNGFPVVQDYDPDSVQDDGVQTFGTFRGVVLRDQLIVLLKLKIFEEYPDIQSRLENLKSEDFRDAYPRFPPIQQIHISAHEHDFTIDLLPFMNSGTYTIRDCSSLPRIFRLFRALGLRHVVVINEHNEVLGMVTRKDLARYKVSVSFSKGKLRIKELDISR